MFVRETTNQGKHQKPLHVLSTGPLCVLSHSRFPFRHFLRLILSVSALALRLRRLNPAATLHIFLDQLLPVLFISNSSGSVISRWTCSFSWPLRPLPWWQCSSSCSTEFPMSLSGRLDGYRYETSPLTSKIRPSTSIEHHFGSISDDRPRSPSA